MSAVSLTPVTQAMLHAYYRDFQRDPAIFMDPSACEPYVYAPEKVDACFERLRARDDRVDFMILLDGAPVGEIALKRIDRDAGTCELSVHLQRDAVKNRGVGTRAERLAVRYAFGTLRLRAVLADAVLANARSRHVLEKVGFTQTGEKDGFALYRLERPE